MLDKFLDEYIENLLEKQNNGALKEQTGLFSKSEYYKLLKPVIDIIRNNGDLTIEEMRTLLFQKSGIEEEIKRFVYKKEMVPGLVFSYGTKNYKETVIIGNRQEVALNQNGEVVPSIEEMTEDTIFDLASITKLYTSLSTLKLVQDGLIRLDDDVTKYAPQFVNLKGITIFDLLSFGVPLKTKERVDKAPSKEEAEKILFSLEVDKESQNLRPYTDMGAMVLKYVIECASGENYYNYVEKNILKPLQMIDTHVIVPNQKISRVASTNLGGMYYKDGNFSISKNSPKGIVYDPKARIMGASNGDLTGHAGLFSTASDMTKLAKGIINGQVIDDKFVEEMAKNRTGRSYEEMGTTKYVQYLGYLCYSKNPILDSSEVYHALSSRALASAGWTGTQLTVDPLNELYLFMAGNRSHNRMTYIDAAHKDKVKVDENGKRTIILPNGQEMIDATRFAWDRDSVIVHPALRLAIQYKMLEDFYELSNEKIEEDSKSIRL